MTGFSPLYLSTPQLLEYYWPMCEPLFKRCVEEAVHGEYNLSDLQSMAAAGKLHIFVVTDSNSVQLALAVEILSYPRLAAVNIVALGGSSTEENYKKFWKSFAGWAFINGIQTIQGMVSPAMERFTRKFGFKPVYSLVRYDLGASDD